MVKGTNSRPPRRSESDPDGGLADVFFGFRPALLRLVRRFTGREDAEDIVSETYLRTYERFGDETIEYPKAFLLKTARNLALNHIARHGNSLTGSIEDSPNADVYLVSEELESQVEAQDKFRLFCVAADSLPPKCRRAFLLKRVHGWSLQAIADELGISISTAEKHVAKGLLRCARELAERGYDLKGTAAGTDRKTRVSRP